MCSDFFALLEPEPPLLQRAQVLDEVIVAGKGLPLIAVYRVKGRDAVFLSDPDDMQITRAFLFAGLDGFVQHTSLPFLQLLLIN